jgi:hypothetical protein
MFAEAHEQVNDIVAEVKAETGAQKEAGKDQKAGLIRSTPSREKR